MSPRARLQCARSNSEQPLPLPLPARPRPRTHRLQPQRPAPRPASPALAPRRPARPGLPPLQQGGGGTRGAASTAREPARGGEGRGGDTAGREGSREGGGGKSEAQGASTRGRPALQVAGRLGALLKKALFLTLLLNPCEDRGRQARGSPEDCFSPAFYNWVRAEGSRLAALLREALLLPSFEVCVRTEGGGLGAVLREALLLSLPFKLFFFFF